MSRRVIHYASPTPAPIDEDEDDPRAVVNIRRLTVLTAVCLGSVFGITCYCVAAIGWAQRREGVTVLQEGVVATDVYERWLMDYPTVASIVIFALVAICVLVNVLRLRWSPLFLVVIVGMPFVWVPWVAMMAMTIWEEAFP
jgi:hypothetical protein